eukprot:gene4480-14640_t
MEKPRELREGGSTNNNQSVRSGRQDPDMSLASFASTMHSIPQHPSASLSLAPRRAFGRSPGADPQAGTLPETTAQPGSSQQPYGLATELIQTQGEMNHPLHMALPLTGASGGPRPSSGQPHANWGLAEQLADAGYHPPQRQSQQQESGGGYPGDMGGLAQDPNVAFSGANLVTPDLVGDEPHYGIVQELLDPYPADPVTSRDFGLAAEVERRRATDPLTSEDFGLAAEVENGRATGVGRSWRPRKRLAAVGAPGVFGLSEELARRQAEEHDPFGTAARQRGKEDYIQPDDELLKFPALPVTPFQDFGDVPLRIPGSGESVATAAPHAPPHMGSFDDEARPHCIADPVVEWEPPGQVYRYNEDTGMLNAAGHMKKDVPHDPDDLWADEIVDNTFNGKLNQKDVPHDLYNCGQEIVDDTIHGKLNPSMTNVATSLNTQQPSFLTMLVGGFSLLNFYMTFWYKRTHGEKKFLMYYCPIAFQMTQFYNTLIPLAVKDVPHDPDDLCVKRSWVIHSTDSSWAIHRDRGRFIELVGDSSSSWAIHRDRGRFIELVGDSSRSWAIHRDRGPMRS